ncbi:MAG: hypothetical protein M8467_10915 [Anaerolineae bacterium]|nr:hypothetical protein [Anaerolineae bacterium]
MVKKIVLGGLLVALIGVLAVGAVIRTLDKTGNVAEAQGLGRGRASDGVTYVAANSSETRGGGYGTGGGQGRVADDGIVGPLSSAPTPEDWTVYEGTVLQVPAAGVDMIVQTDEGEELVVGTGPGYLDTAGFGLQEGEQVRVAGFWEDGEFKAGELTRLRDGETITVRDQYGRPAWSGGYGRGIAATDGTIEGRGPGTGPSRGQGGYSGEDQLDAPGDGTGTGQAQVDEWITLYGTVQVATVDEMIVQTGDGQEILVDGRAWRFAQELGFMAYEGDQLSLTGFYEDGDFEVGQINDETTGQSASLRDENGRPLWAGRGRQGS